MPTTLFYVLILSLYLTSCFVTLQTSNAKRFVAARSGNLDKIRQRKTAKDKSLRHVLVAISQALWGLRRLQVGRFGLPSSLARLAQQVCLFARLGTFKRLVPPVPGIWTRFGNEKIKAKRKKFWELRHQYSVGGKL
jgi:hypothetical protein